MNSNPTPASALSEAHRALLDDMLRLGHLIQTSGNVGELHERLSSTYTHLCHHLRLEEQGGYFDNVQEREPRLQRAVSDLAAEHRELRQSLDALRAEAGVANAVDDAMRAKVRAWIDRYLAHETHENDVAQDEVDLDVGTVD